MIRIAITAGLVFSAPQAWAAQDVDRLLKALHLSESIEIMRQEGLDYITDLRELMSLPQGGNIDVFTRIYDTQAMSDMFRQGFNDSFGNTDTDALITFLESDAGAAIIERELETRRAFQDKMIEDAARDIYQNTPDDDALLKEVRRYVDVNDLIEFNVMGAMNADYQFNMGLLKGGETDQNEDEIITMVWDRVEETRADTDIWSHSFLMMVFEDTDLADVTAYTDLSATSEGQAMNAALFAGFDEMYKALSFATGLAIADQMKETDL